MMKGGILVGDIGSTKSAWWLATNPPRELRLQGFNPVMHDMAEGHALFQDLRQAAGSQAITHLYYYGAGVTGPDVAGRLRTTAAESFPNSHIHIASDLTGAAKAACGATPGAVAILGTGSHAAIFDGEKIVRQAVSLGYILGDEGSGCDIGKCLIQAYFYRQMPDAVHHTMTEYLPHGRETLFRELNASKAPNRYLADFARVAARHHDDPWISALVASRFEIFVKRHLLPLVPEYPVHVVGSIGSIFAGLMKNELERAGLIPGDFIPDPTYRLFVLHLHDDRQEN